MMIAPLSSLLFAFQRLLFPILLATNDGGLLDGFVEEAQVAVTEIGVGLVLFLIVTIVTLLWIEANKNRYK